MLLVVDQLPEWAFEQKRSVLSGGFARLLAEGEWRVGRHPSSATLTAPGHALLGTGEPPARSGIIANEWWSRDEARIVAAVDGPGTQSTRFLKVPGLGDSIRADGRGGKAVGVALKSRAAILSLGHHGLAVFYDGKTGRWTSRGASMAGAVAPSWLAEHERKHPIAARLVRWEPLDPTRVARLSGVADTQTGEVGEKGFGPTFPHDPRLTRAPSQAVAAMPLGNELVLETSLAAITGEHLGVDETPDLLTISLSAHDLIAHGWGHESWEAWDAALRLDTSLKHFLDDLDRIVGRGRWAMIVTSDHGGSPLPDRIAGGRHTVEHLARVANDAASSVLGPGEWIASATYPNIYLSRAALTRGESAVAAATREIVVALRALPGLAIVDRTAVYAGDCESRRGDGRTICLALDPERSGEVIYVPARGWIIEEEAERLATGHGSLHDYDRLVPVIILAPGRTAHAAQNAASGSMCLADVAPLLASWLGVPSPLELPRDEVR